MYSYVQTVCITVPGIPFLSYVTIRIRINTHNKFKSVNLCVYVHITHVVLYTICNTFPKVYVHTQRIQH